MKPKPKKKSKIFRRTRKPFVKLDDLLDAGKFTEAITQQTRRVKWLYLNHNRNTHVVDEKLVRLIYHRMQVANIELCQALEQSNKHMMENFMHYPLTVVNEHIEHVKQLLEQNKYKPIAS